jgi:hypothetical protein
VRSHCTLRGWPTPTSGSSRPGTRTSSRDFRQDRSPAPEGRACSPHCTRPRGATCTSWPRPEVGTGSRSIWPATGAQWPSGGVTSARPGSAAASTGSRGS